MFYIDKQNIDVFPFDNICFVKNNIKQDNVEHFLKLLLKIEGIKAPF